MCELLRDGKCICRGDRKTVEKAHRCYRTMFPKSHFNIKTIN